MTKQKTTRVKCRALVLATAALAINFWAWSLLSPLGTTYGKLFDLSPARLSLLLATPVIIGSFGRIALGIVTDRFGGRLTFTMICLVTAIPVFSLLFVDTYTQLLAVAILLGTGGTAFVVGIPYVSTWFSPASRGLALGVYSMGNAGTALSGFLTPRLTDMFGRDFTFIVVGSLLIAMAMLFIVVGRDAPGSKRSKGRLFAKLRQAIQFRITWDLSIVYVITFGAFIAFGVYLPVLLSLAYDLSATDAATRAAGFVLLATIARPVGGWISDKVGGRFVIRVSLLAIAVLSCFVAFQTTLGVQTTVAYLTLASILGCANGAVFALVGRLVQTEIMGSVSGVIGAIGALGGFLPPLILGVVYQYTHSYAPALIMLSISTTIVLVYVNVRFDDQLVYKNAI